MQFISSYFCFKMIKMMKSTIWEWMKSILNKGIFFNLIVLNESCFCWIEFFNWWISLFHLIHSFQIEEFQWIIKEINLNNQFVWNLFSSCWEENLLSNELSISMKWWLIHHWVFSFNFYLEWIIWIESLYQVETPF